MTTEREQESRGPKETRYYQSGHLDLVTRHWSRVVKPDSPMERVTATPQEHWLKDVYCQFLHNFGNIVTKKHPKIVKVENVGDAD